MQDIYNMHICVFYIAALLQFYYLLLFSKKIIAQSLSKMISSNRWFQIQI